MIKAQQITKSYGELDVLKGVDFEGQASDIVSIVGSSGAGKTTFLQILGTLEQADKGKLFFDNQDLSELNSKELAHFRNNEIGFIFQFHHLLPEFTALENVLIPSMIGKDHTKAKEQKAKDLLDLLGLKDRMSHKPSKMSGGEQQRVAVARALINNPRLILADEPTGNLDSANALEMHNLFLDLRKEFNCSFVIITHNEELATMADRRLLMKDGQLIY